MKYFCIEPEVAGGWGANTIADTSVHPPNITRLHYEFDGWLGDALLTSFPCFIVTDDARRRLGEAEASGVAFDDVEITTSGEFDDINEFDPFPKLPEFAWLKVVGDAGNSDFGTLKDGTLVVSERALEVLKELGIRNAVVYPFESAAKS